VCRSVPAPTKRIQESRGLDNPRSSRSRPRPLVSVETPSEPKDPCNCRNGRAGGALRFYRHLVGASRGQRWSARFLRVWGSKRYGAGQSVSARATGSRKGRGFSEARVEHGRRPLDARTDGGRRTERRNVAETRGPRGPQVRILVVDDDPHAREATLAALRDRGHRVAGAEDGLQALQQLQRAQFQVVVTNIQMPRMDGLALLREIRRQAYPLRVVVRTALLDAALQEVLRRAGAASVIMKGEPMAALARAIEEAARAASAP
jgi:CheY-like chemotaxis protein